MKHRDWPPTGPVKQPKEVSSVVLYRNCQKKKKTVQFIQETELQILTVNAYEEEVGRRGMAFNSTLPVPDLQQSQFSVSLILSVPVTVPFFRVTFNKRKLSQCTSSVVKWGIFSFKAKQNSFFSPFTL